MGIVNNANHDIAYYVAIGGEDGILYPDTSLPASLSPPFPIAKANNTSTRDFGLTKKELFNEIPSDTLSIYLFHADTLSKLKWEVVRTEYKILKRYDLSSQNLNELEWRVYFPPTNEMDEVKMFPK